MCVASDRKAYRITFEAGSVEVSAADRAAKLVASATGMNGDDLTWIDRNLTLTQARSDETMVLDFVEAGRSTKVACDGANHVVTRKLR